MKLTWENKGDNIHIAFTDLAVRDIYGKQRKVAIALRVDGRERPARVDRCTYVGGGMWTPFEAIDGGRGARTITEGKRLAREWLIKHQG